MYKVYPRGLLKRYIGVHKGTSQDVFWHTQGFYSEVYAGLLKRYIGLHKGSSHEVYTHTLVSSQEVYRHT